MITRTLRVTLALKIPLTATAGALALLVLSGTVARMHLETSLEERLEAELITKSGIIAALFSPDSLPGPLPASLTAMAGRGMVRISVVTSDSLVFDAGPGALSPGRIDSTGRAALLRAQRNTPVVYRHAGPDGSPWFFVSRGIGRGAVRVSSSRTALDEELKRFTTLMAAAGGLLLLVVAGLSSRYARSVSTPLIAMAHTARLVSAGAVEKRVDMKSGDELGEMARSLNQMAGKLNSEIERLKKLERVRSEFLGNVSHELRTPIFSLQGYLETLLDGAVDDPSVNREFLGKAHHHAERLSALLNDLIEISRIESGEMRMSLRFFPAVEFVRQVAMELQPAAQRKGLALEVAAGEDPALEVYADRERLRQVLVNLIDNAIKYTAEGGRVTVGVAPSGARCEFSVEDTGCGIPSEHLPRIFERFYRVDRDRSREVGGTGLGLAIVKHIVEAHGGTIRVSSVVGKGSTFTFDLKR